MKYVILVILVVCMATFDILTGLIKAFVTGKPSSQKMRVGLGHKAAEIVLMFAMIALDIGLQYLGMYYDAEMLTAYFQGITPLLTCISIVLMEVISILENFCDIFPQAKWASKMLKKLKQNSDSTEN